jgi:hypothetical protein
MEKRKSGTFTSAINETQIKAILAVMETNSRVPTNMLRELMRPLYPVGTSLDAKLIFNFRLKLKRMQKNSKGTFLDTLLICGLNISRLLKNIQLISPLGQLLRMTRKCFYPPTI